MKSDILVILPTRERPIAALQALASILDSSQGRVDVVICLDEDDDKSLRMNGRNVTTRIAPRKTFTQWINAAAVEFCRQYPIIGWAADDIRYLKPLWDFKVRATLRAGLGIVYGPDGIQNENLPTHPFVSSQIVQALGYLIHPKLKHYYNDNYLKELGTHLGCLKYLKDFTIEHRHHSTGRSTFDSLNRLNESKYAEDTETFKAALPTIADDAQTVRAFINASAAAVG